MVTAPAHDRALPEGLPLEYSADLSLLPSHVPFLEVGFDQGAERYLERAKRLRHGRMLTWLHSLLTGFLSDFDANGLLGIYPMHVMSETQWGKVLAQVESGAPYMGSAGDSSRTRGTGKCLLDVGAGSGDVTAELSKFFSKTTVTETSLPMQRRLKRRGFEVVPGDLASQEHLGRTFDAVSLLNVLDRCDAPLGLLSAARAHVRPGGLLLIALVLPYEPVVLSSGRSRAPRERLPISARGFEEAASELIEFGLEPLGLKVELLSRVPYLSGGDAHSPLYVLDDLIVVCRAQGEIPIIGAGRG